MSLKFKTVLMLAVILLQLTVLSHFTLLGVIPNYILVFIIALCVICDSGDSVVFAAAVGLAADMLTGSQIGLNTLLYMYIAFASIAVTGLVYNKRLKVVIPMCFIFSFVYELLFGIFSSLLRRSVFYYESVFRVVLPVAVINTLIFIPVYIILSKLRFEKKRKGIKYEQQI